MQMTIWFLEALWWPLVQDALSMMLLSIVPLQQTLQHFYLVHIILMEYLSVKGSNNVVPSFFCLKNHPAIIMLCLLTLILNHSMGSLPWWLSNHHHDNLRLIFIHYTIDITACSLFIWKYNTWTNIWISFDQKFLPFLCYPLNLRKQIIYGVARWDTLRDTVGR